MYLLFIDRAFSSIVISLFSVCVCVYVCAEPIQTQIQIRVLFIPMTFPVIYVPLSSQPNFILHSLSHFHMDTIVALYICAIFQLSCILITFWLFTFLLFLLSVGICLTTKSIYRFICKLHLFILDVICIPFKRIHNFSLSHTHIHQNCNQQLKGFHILYLGLPL